MTDKIWVEAPEGGLVYVSYDELDPDVYGEFCRPSGHFSYSVERFKHLPLPKVPFYIDEWLPVQGKIIIYGPRKSGKSFCAMQLGRCIASGEPFLGRKTTQGTVLYLQFELGQRTLLDRIRKTEQDYDNMYVGTIFDMKIDESRGQDILQKEVDLIRPNVLILDPLYKIMSGDENEAHDSLVVLNYLDTLLEMYSEHNMSVVLMHHSGKDQSRGARGSSNFEGWVDSSIELKRTSSETDRELRARITPKALRHAPTEGSIDIVLGDTGEFQLGDRTMTIKEKVIAYFKEYGPCRVQDIIDSGIGSRKSVYDARKELLETEKICEKGNGLYAWKGDV
jgi:hypothetical protein